MCLDSFAVKSPGGHADVEIGGVRRDGLQELHLMKPCDAPSVLIISECDSDTVPQVLPRQNVTIEHVVERADARKPPRRFVSRLGHRVITPGEDRHHLLERHRVTGLQVDCDVVPDSVVALEQPERGSWRRPREDSVVRAAMATGIRD